MTLSNFTGPSMASEFPEAVEALARKPGWRSAAGANTNPTTGRPGHNAWICMPWPRCFRRVLGNQDGRPARDYIARRGLARKSWGRFALGWAPAGWNELRDHLRGQGFADEAAEKAGLLFQIFQGWIL